MAARKDEKKAGEIRQFIKKWDDQNKYNVTHYHEMTQFIQGEQWEDEDKDLFKTYKKIPLTVNKIQPMKNHLVGEQRQNTPNLQIMPDDHVEERTAEVRAALIKEISLNSDAKLIYQTCFDQAVTGGYSAYCIYLDYINNDSFLQEIKLRGFKDPTKTFFDIGAETPCKTDGMASGYRTTMTRKKFRSLYGSSLEKKIGYTSTDISDTDKIVMSFSDEYAITLIDYFERVSTLVTLCHLSNGRSIRKKDLGKLQKMEVEGNMMYMHEGELVSIIDERQFPEYKVEHSKWAGDYELEKTDFPTQQLPMIFVDQNSYYDKNGKQICSSFFKNAKDSQRYLNYLRTQSAYLIKISRYEQFIASKQNVKSNDTQAIWRDPSQVQGTLYYDESPNGNKPEQLRPPELSPSLQIQYESATLDLEMSTGIYKTQMGEQGNEVSGVAIDKRIKRGSYNTDSPFAKLNTAIACGASVIDEAIPSVYDTERLMQLELKDSGSTKVSLNKPMNEYGDELENDMSQGNYKIRTVPGQSLEGQKTDNLQSMDMVLSKDPEAFALIADLYVESLPMANSIEMRNRLRTRVPPEIIEAGKTGKPLPPQQPQQDPMVMIKMQELQQKMQEAQMNAQFKQKEIELKEQELMMKSHQAGIDFSKELQQLETQKAETLAKLKEQEMRYEGEMARIQADLHKNHSQNVIKILTHQPDHLKPMKQPTKSGDNA